MGRLRLMLRLGLLAHERGKGDYFGALSFLSGGVVAGKVAWTDWNGV